MTETTTTIVFVIFGLAFMGDVERIYRMEKTLGRINNLLADLCDHLKVDTDDD